MNSFAVDFRRSQESDKVLSHRVVEESRSLFHCYINEVEHLGRARLDSKASGLKHSSLHTRETLGDNELEEEMNNLAKFNIPNFVSSEQSSMLGDDDLLLSEQPIILNNDADDSSASNPETSSQNPQLRSQTPHELF
ncbi:melanocortin-2 receptor accessory protein 2-like isoform X2 [Polyodon spathula]|nr:melanocortin-2 receptor accessory protein 2-like isoform X2 [Polyodon spathula]